MKAELSQYESVFCDHTRMAPCCDPDCGHYSCPCGIYWDDGAESDFTFEEMEEMSGWKEPALA